MKELIRTNDPVLISFVEALLNDAGIEHALLDANMSVVEGSIGILPKRVLVREDEWNEASRILTEAEISHDTGE